MNLPLSGSAAWEIDASCLKYERKIASGPFSNLYKGAFCNQEVAFKVPKAENLNESIQKDFAQEVYILRVKYIISSLLMGMLMVLVYKLNLAVKCVTRMLSNLWGPAQNLQTCSMSQNTYLVEVRMSFCTYRRLY
ncbi:serine/threonine-protein kinase STY17-like [Prosopis cineraria]|uniref:serine/threonine-protein kinase STY17-like n=1 Tax=Prosopis cineraria TaxID=364024 RepID=UPI00240FFC72|nr:serine/threonine-protein kinase STY17-like [Prosopis cineraria]XP_054797364.1 serine/threonine-protein kinase STY17-like [Prosopis cineraria]